MSSPKDKSHLLRQRRQSCSPSPLPSASPPSKQRVMSTSPTATSVPTKRRNSRISFLSRMVSEAASSDSHHGHHRESLANVVNKERYRLVVLGGSRVGKTAIIQQFLYDVFPTEHAATVEELHKSEYEVRGLGTVAVEILDTSGSFEFPAMKRLAIAKGNAFLLVFAVDDKESFEEVVRLRDLVTQVKATSAHIPLVIVGNKNDVDLEKRQVGRELAECECIDWDVAYIECSAKNGNVRPIFQQLLLQAHLKGVLKSATFTLSPSTSVDVAPRPSQHRRSSLPVNDLFAQQHSSVRSHRGSSPGRKRNSCALS